MEATVNRNTRDARDTLVMVLVTGVLLIATVYLFLHPSEGVFAAWCGLAATVIGAYHWINYRDDKEPDQCQPSP